MLRPIAVAVALVNAHRSGSLAARSAEVFEDNGYRAPHEPGDWGALAAAADCLASVLDSVVDGDHRGAIAGINERLESMRVVPHLKDRDGRRELHFHAPDASFADGWVGGALAALAVAYSQDESDRIGRCRAADCAELFLDRGRNKQRRFCSLRCQNRVKSSAYRRRTAG